MTAARWLTSIFRATRMASLTLSSRRATQKPARLQTGRALFANKNRAADCSRLGERHEDFYRSSFYDARVDRYGSRRWTPARIACIKAAGYQPTDWDNRRVPAGPAAQYR